VITVVGIAAALRLPRHPVVDSDFP
jgi:hypothetical protein